MGKGKGQKVMDFDLATAMTKKECARPPARAPPPAPAERFGAERCSATQPRAPPPPPGRNRKLTKMECMVNYHLARVPFWNGKESVAMANAEKCAAQPQSRCLPCAGRGPRARAHARSPPARTREMIASLKTKVKNRWEEQNGIY